MFIRTSSCALLALLVFTSLAVAEDWPTWRHDRLRSAVTSESLELPLEEVWRFESRQSQVAPRMEHAPRYLSYPDDVQYTLPVISVGDAVYFSSAHEGRVACLEAATGQLRWEFLTGGGVNRTPMFAEGRIYFGSDEGIVYCLDAETGAEIWRFDANPASRWFLSYGEMISVWPVQTDVFVDNGVAYFATGIFPHDGTFVFAVNAETGEQIWRSAQMSENGWRNSLAPGGHLFLTTKHLWVPKDFRGYSGIGYGAGIPFLRENGDFGGWYGTPDPEFEGENDWFWPLLGIVKDGVRYQGNWAAEADGERTELWRHDLEGRMVDIESAFGLLADGSQYEPLSRYDPDLCSVVYAGDTLFHTAFATDPAVGDTTIYARNPQTGEELWSTTVPGHGNQLVVANGRLMVGTRDGKIYCLAPQGSEKHGVVTEQIENEPLEITPEIEEAAVAILQATGIENGYLLALDCQDGQLPFALARHSNAYIVAVFNDEAALLAARQAYVAADLHLNNIATYLAEPDAKLPFPANFADCVVSDAALRGGALPGNAAEVARLTKPLRGVALLSHNTSGDLAAWRQASGLTGWETIEYAGTWEKWTRPELPEAGHWTHMHGDPGGSGCSDDGALLPPLGVVWYGPPYVHHGTDQTPLIVNGVLISPDAHALEAFDQYNGRKLWRLEAENIGIGRGKLAASQTHVYVLYGKAVIEIDLFTGEHTSTLNPPYEPENGWRWMAVDPNGKTVYGAGDWGVWAIETESGQGRTRWQIGSPEEGQRIGGNFAMDGGRIYVLGQRIEGELREAAIAEMRAWFETQPAELREEFEGQVDQRDIRKLMCFDATSGELVWERGVDTSNCGGEWLRPANFRGPYILSDLFVAGGVVLIGTSGGADKWWQTWNSGNYSSRAFNAHDAQSGEHLWYRFANYRARPVIIENTIHAEPWAYDLRTGERQQTVHPITGAQEDWVWCRYDKQCGIFSASRYFLFGRSMGIGYQDLYNDDGIYTFWHSRASCWIDCVTGGGMMIKPPQSLGCGCEWNMHFTIAMATVDTQPTAAPETAQPGPMLPVKHLHLDMAATGDRHDAAGNLWLKTDSLHRHPLLLRYPISYALYENGRPLVRSAVYTPIANTETPFVFTTAFLGLKRAVLPITTPADGEGLFRVRLGFAAPPGDVPGQRTFSVALNGERVLEEFDIVAEAGGTDIALWKEFTLPIEDNLVIDLIAPESNPAEAQMPLLCAVEVFREEVTTLGLAAPLDTWLGETKTEDTVTLSIANHFENDFSGRLVVESPAGFTLTPTAGDAIQLAAGERGQLELNVSGQPTLATGYHIATVKLVDEAGAEHAACTLPLEWLGPLERAVVWGTCRSPQDERYWNYMLVHYRPHVWEHWLAVRQGAQEPGDGGGSHLYFGFDMHDRYKARIRRVRLRLHVSPSRMALQDVSLADRWQHTPGEGDWGILRQLAAPPGKNVNSIVFADDFELRPEATRLAPVTWSEQVIEGTVPGDLSHITETHTYYLEIEPTSVEGVAYWGQQPLDQSLRPVVLVDFEPEPAEE